MQNDIRKLINDYKARNIALILLFCLLVYLSIFPRITEVLNKNYLFGYDQGRDYLAVYNIVVNHKLTLIGSEIGAGVAGFRGIFHGPFYYYLLSIPFFLLSGDPYSGVLMLFILGIATIVFSYFFGKRLFGHWGGILTAFLIAVSPPFIAQSRFVWNTNPSSLFILLAFYFVYKSINGNRKCLFLAAFFSAFIYNFQLAVALPLSLTLFLFSVILLRLRLLKDYLYLLCGFILGFFPMIIFEVKHNFMALHGAYDYIINHKDTQVTTKFMELLIGDHFKDFINNFYYTFPDQMIIPPFLVLIIFIPFFNNLVHEKDLQKKNFFIYLTSLPLVTFFIFSFLRNYIYSYYLISLNFVYIFSFSYVAWSSFKKNNPLFKSIIVIITAAFLLRAIPYSIKNFLDDYGDYGGTAKIKGKIDAIDYIYKDAQGKKFGLLVFSPPIYIYPYDYILSWYGGTNYNYIPNKEKKGLFYLLIEKDHAKPWSYKGWLETVIKTGRVLETKELPSGFIVQKRIEEI